MKQPSTSQVLCFAAAIILIGAVLAAFAGGLTATIDANGDNGEYIAIARHIRNGDLVGASRVSQHIWGLPYMVAGISAVTRLPEFVSLYLISLLSTCCVVVLSCELYGPWPTLYFLAIDWQWLKTMCYAGAEPAFIALTLGALLAARKKLWTLAALLASFSILVRPIGILLLASIFGYLLWTRAWNQFMRSFALAASVGTAYAIPLILATHDILFNYHAYQHKDWHGGSPITLPFAAMVANFHNRASMGIGVNLFLKPAFVVLTVAILLLIALKPLLREKAAANPLQLAFVVIYCVFFWTYNAPMWALAEYARFISPVLPALLWMISDWLPESWTLISVIALASTIHAAGPSVVSLWRR